MTSIHGDGQESPSYPGEPYPNVSPPGACAMVIFGATGDLTKRLLIPAVYNLAAAGLLPQQFAVVGVAIEPLTGQQFAEKLGPPEADGLLAKGSVDLIRLVIV